MKFKVDTGQIKTRDLLACENSLTGTIDMMSRFMVNELGEYISENDAREMLLDLDIEEQIRVQEEFVNNLIPNLKRRRS